MKKLIALALLILPLSAAAQTTTNISYVVTVETVSGGVTNSTPTSFRWDWGVGTKDGLKISGVVFGFNGYKSSGGVLAFGPWIKSNINDWGKSYQDAKEVVDNSALVAKLTSLLLQNPDLLTGTDMTNLNTIAAKAP